MRQVPSSSAQRTPVRYGFIGNGRLSRHLQHYMRWLDVPYDVWSRASKLGLGEALGDCDVLLIAVSDGALAELAARANAELPGRPCVHFSGCIDVPGVEAWHPLMTFADRLYDPAFYAMIPFVGVAGQVPFATRFPAFRNQTAVLASADDRALYHAACVLGGNLAQILAGRARTIFRDRLALDPQLLAPFLKKSAENAADSGAASLSGPIARGDAVTIEANLKALDGDPFAAVYRAVLTAYREINRPINDESNGEPDENLRLR